MTTKEEKILPRALALAALPTALSFCLTRWFQHPTMARYGHALLYSASNAYSWHDDWRVLTRQLNWLGFDVGLTLGLVYAVSHIEIGGLVKRCIKALARTSIEPELVGAVFAVNLIAGVTLMSQLSSTKRWCVALGAIYAALAGRFLQQ